MLVGSQFDFNTPVQTITDSTQSLLGDIMQAPNLAEVTVFLNGIYMSSNFEYNAAGEIDSDQSQYNLSLITPGSGNSVATVRVNFDFDLSVGDVISITYPTTEVIG